jgi:hypothetical protein
MVGAVREVAGYYESFVSSQVVTSDEAGKL